MNSINMRAPEQMPKHGEKFLLYHVDSPLWMIQALYKVAKLIGVPSILCSNWLSSPITSV